MRFLDRERGRVLGVNAVDLFVIVVVAFLAFSLASKLLSPSLVYSGEEMYSAIQDYRMLDSKGFLLEARVKGKWIVDEREFDGTGIIADTRSGSFALRTEDGRYIWIGGSMAYLEDIAAEKIVFIPGDSYVVTLTLEPREFNSFKELLVFLENKKKELRAETLRLGGSTVLPADISFIAPGIGAQEILNQFDGLYKVKYFSVIQAGKAETRVRLRLADLEELKRVSIPSSKVVISRTYIYAGYQKAPEFLGPGYHVASLEELQ
jgi:hypothetical protein